MKPKTCYKCKQPLPVSNFSKHKLIKDGLSNWCKVCCTEYNNKYSIKCHIKYPWKRPYKNIKARCNNKKDKAYPRYGGRGIKCLITLEELEKLWIRDKAYKMKIPSIDREDNDGDYTYSNCRFIEKGENSAKDKRKPVLQYDLDGNYIKEWISQSEASRSLKIKKCGISQCCKEITRYSHAGGFIWRHKKTRKDKS